MDKKIGDEVFAGTLNGTGTLQIADIHVLPDAGLTDTELLRLVAAVEHPSEHPLPPSSARPAPAVSNFQPWKSFRPSPAAAWPPWSRAASLHR